MSSAETKRARLRCTIDLLTQEIAKGMLAVTTAERLHRAYSDDGLGSALYFFATVAVCCTDAMLLSFSKVFARRGSSISIEYLLNCAQSDPSTFPYVDGSELLAKVGEHRKDLCRVEPLAELVLPHRDKLLAHLDRMLVNRPEEIAGLLAAIPYDQVSKALDGGLAIVGCYRRYLDHAEFFFEKTRGPRGGLSQDLDYLFGLIELDNARSDCFEDS